MSTKSNKERYYYNPEIKLAYLEQSLSNDVSRNQIGSILHTFSELEYTKHKDVCECSVDDVMKCITERGKLSEKTKETTIGHLKRYIRWCIDNSKLCVNDELLHIRVADFRRIKLKKDQLISSPAHLQSYLNMLFDQEEDEGSDVLYRCYYWLIYGGLGLDEALDTLKAEVDLANMRILHNGKEVPIYREALPSIKGALTLKAFRRKGRSKYQTDFIREVPRIPSEYLLNSATYKYSYEGIKTVIRRAKKKSLPDGSPIPNIDLETVWRCGWFYRINEHEKMGLRPNLAIPISEAVNEIKRRNPDQEFGYRRLQDMERNYTHMYETWKTTFNS